MNITNLKKKVEKDGKELKSYRELCDVLEIKPKGGNQKKAQLKEIESHVKLSRGKGYRLIVDEIYDKPNVRVDRKNKYGRLVELLLTDYFSKSIGNQLEMTLNDILRLVHLINNNYSLISNNVPKFSKVMGIEEKITYDHFSLANSSFKDIVERVLNNLQNMRLIKYEKNAVFITDLNNVKKLATPDEEELFIRAGEEALDEIFKEEKRSHKNINNVRYTKHWAEYKKLSNTYFKKLMREELDKKVKNAYIGYRIIINKDVIARAHSELLIEYLDDLTRKSYLNEIEYVVLEDLVNKATIRHEKAKDPNSKINEKLRQYRVRFSYLEDNKKIINLAHSKDAEDISKLINL